MTEWTVLTQAKAAPGSQTFTSRGTFVAPVGITYVVCTTSDGRATGISVSPGASYTVHPAKGEDWGAIEWYFDNTYCGETGMYSGSLTVSWS